MGTTADDDVYMGVLGFVNGFAKSGRYSINQDNSTGRYDLLIRNVEPADAGKFVCVSNGGMGKLRSAELTVIGTVNFLRFTNLYRFKFVPLLSVVVQRFICEGPVKVFKHFSLGPFGYEPR